MKTVKYNLGKELEYEKLFKDWLEIFRHKSVMNEIKWKLLKKRAKKYGEYPLSKHFWDNLGFGRFVSDTGLPIEYIERGYKAENE